jgi:hypothetical protein
VAVSVLCIYNVYSIWNVWLWQVLLLLFLPKRAFVRPAFLLFMPKTNFFEKMLSKYLHV